MKIELELAHPGPALATLIAGESWIALWLRELTEDDTYGDLGNNSFCLHI